MILTNLLHLTNLTNHLKNPSFEHGVRPWYQGDYTNSNWSSVRGDAYEGHRYLAIRPQGPPPTLYQWAVAQDVKLIEGHQYNVSVAWRARQTNGGSCSLAIYLFETGLAHYPVGEASTTGDTDWAILTGDVPVTATTRNQTFSVDGNCEYNSMQEVMELDDARLIDITAGPIAHSSL